MEQINEENPQKPKKIIILITVLSLFFLIGLGYASYKILNRTQNPTIECDLDYAIAAVISDKTDMDKLNSIIEEYDTKINSTHFSESRNAAVVYICIPEGSYKPGENYDLLKELKDNVVFEEIYIEHLARPA